MNGGDRDFRRALVEAYAVNERMNRLVLDSLHPSIWRAKPPGGKGRTIAAIFSHVHNVRRKWLRLSAPHLELPAPLHRARCTEQQAREALADSAGRLCEMIEDGFAAPETEVRMFCPDGWLKPWPAGAAMVVYMVAHDAHHRGQVCMLAGQLGRPLPPEAAGRIWNWERLWKDCGFTRPR